MSFEHADALGPDLVIHIHRPAVGLRAILVVDNVACGPAIGGCRMAPDVTLAECFRLARAMTFKNAAAGLAHGGGKSVIAADPRMPAAEKERLIRAFARAIGDVRDYIVGPDMGTDERCMAHAHDEIGRAVGLPAELGGIPLDELGATGFGLAICAEEAHRAAGVALDGARVAIQGFGAVGRHAARFLAERGARVVAASDSAACVSAPDGLDVETLIAHKARTGSVGGLSGATTGASEAVVDVDCELWIPAARPDAVRADNVDRLRAKVIVPGANIGVTDEAERMLAARGVLVMPDYIANAGGVICAAVEYHGGTRAQAFATIEERIRANSLEVLARAREENLRPRQAADRMARERVESAMQVRRFGH
ncbi:MAG: Glu/Leu/Phe/Val dehydrogenase [Chromatiales bacterium]|nr:Glu/Leu/Phe/Val dehydrogenase [Chromatiales bacterium]